MRMQLTSHKQKKNADTSLEEWNYAQGGGRKKKPSPNSSPTFISSDSEDCISVCPMATVSRKSGAGGEQVLKTFNQSKSLARQNILWLTSQPLWVPEGKGMTWAKIPPWLWRGLSAQGAKGKNHFQERHKRPEWRDRV